MTTNALHAGAFTEPELCPGRSNTHERKVGPLCPPHPDSSKQLERQRPGPQPFAALCSKTSQLFEPSRKTIAVR